MTESLIDVVDVNGHALGCPAYNQPTFTLCTCGATERAGLARCACGSFAGFDGFCRHCRPVRNCQVYPPTCAPTRCDDGSYVCCMGAMAE